MRKNQWMILLLGFLLLMAGTDLRAQSDMENLGRGLVGIITTGSNVFLSWRVLGTDAATTTFNIYRNGTKVNTAPISVSNYTDTAGSSAAVYSVRPVIGGVEQAGVTQITSVWTKPYWTVNLQQPAGGTTPDGVAYTYSPSDCSVGDVDGDGEYEIILKWDPSNSKDNSQSGYTGDVYLDCYKLNGTRLWQIDLGKNIRAGAHYTQFQVYDYDSDGKAEMMCKTAPGTKDGTGNFLSLGPAATDDDTADYRNTSGYILTGPEYLTVFNGLTGKEMATVNYVPGRGTVSSWGDTYGNRVDRFLACTAYLDGQHPSAVFCRGYYTRATLVAWDWRGGKLTQRWMFDSNTAGNGGYAGQGSHAVVTGDVDGDGKDEITYGACAINHDGTGLYTTGLGHGDALHLGVFDPDRGGMQVFMAHEDETTNGGISTDFRDAKTGQLIWTTSGTGDNGRGLALHIDPNVRGSECWSATNDRYSCTGTDLGTTKPSCNFGVYWDGDLESEILNDTMIDKWTGTGTNRLLTAYNYGAASNNGTKATPCLSADLFGDWREEVIWRNSNNTQLMIFTSLTPTTHRLYTLMHDRQYREAIAWQNTAYNQPPHTSFYMGEDMAPAPTPNIVLVGATTVVGTPTFTLSATPTRTSSATTTRTNTPTVTSTATFTRTSTATATSTPTFTRTNTLISTPTSTLTATSTPTQTATSTVTSTWTRTSTPTYSWTITSTSTSTRTSTPSPTTTGTSTSTRTSTPSSTPTNTATSTSTSSRTFTTTATPTSTSTSTFTLVNTGTFTPTRTSTYTYTVTSTPTMTGTPTATPTGTVPPSNTYTVTNSPTSTSTATRTMTPTSSPTSTSTNTKTASPTASPTATSTNTSTASSTSSRTSTPTSTWTSSLTATSTRIDSSTPTVTSTPTASDTGTLPPTSTATHTGTSTSTVTSTDTAVFTATPTYTSTSTATLTSTSTPTSTTTATPTDTFTRTPTPTYTSTHTATETTTWTSTSSHTPVFTSTPSWTPTKTTTFTSTVTSSFTWTVTSTASSTATPTPTMTWTFSSTPTATATPTRTASSTSTSTVTPTYTATSTASPTVTASSTPTCTPTAGDCGLVSISNPYPNPVLINGVVKVDLQSVCPKSVRWAVYSSAYRKIGAWSVTVVGSRMTLAWNLTDSTGKKVAAGIYYMVFTPTGQKNKILSVVVLR